MPKQPSRAAARATADVLRKALKPEDEKKGGLFGRIAAFATKSNVDDDKIYDALGAVTSQKEWAFVCQEYSQKYTGSLPEDIEEALNDSGKEKCAQILRRKGVDMSMGAEEPPERAEAAVADAAADPPASPGSSAQAASIAKKLLKAMDRWGTDEDAIFSALSEVKTQKMWGDVIASFRDVGPKFNGGNLLRSLEDELSGSDMQKCRVVLLGNGVHLRGADGNKSKVASNSIADALYEAMKPLGTDEDKIFDSLATVRSQKEWDEVREQFRSRYPDFKSGNVIRALQSELSTGDMQKVRERLEQNGVRLEGDAAVGAADAVADELAKAMKGFGTDEDSVFRALAGVKSQADWKAAKVAFRKSYPDMCGGDLVKALKDELGSSDIEKCRQVLIGNGVSFEGPSKPPSKTEKAAAVADMLFKAMKGFGTNEAEIFLALGGIKSQEGWAAVIEQFRLRHGGFNGGDLMKSLESELDKDDVERCKMTLMQNGIVMSSSSATAEISKEERATAIASSLFKAMDRMGTDEDAIFDALRGVLDQEMWSQVQGAFLRDHPKFNGGDLRKALYDELGRKGADIDKCRRILQQNGVALEGEEGGEAAVRANAIADALFRAMSGVGTDEDAIFTALDSVQSQDDWKTVKTRFRKRYSGFHGGDVIAALRSELSEDDMRKCADSLLRNGVSFTGDKPIAAAAVAASVARALHDAMSGLGTDEDEVYKALRAVRTQDVWGQVQDVFRQRYPGRCGGDLVRCLMDEMSTGEIEKCRQALLQNGVHFDAGSGGAAELRARTAAEILHKAMKGFGTDEDAMYGALENLRDANEWQMTTQSFRRRWPDEHGGDLLAAMRSELNEKELGKCEEILRKKGADLRDPSKGTTPKPPAASSNGAQKPPQHAQQEQQRAPEPTISKAEVAAVQRTLQELQARMQRAESVEARVQALEAENHRLRSLSGELEKELDQVRHHRAASLAAPAASVPADIAAKVQSVEDVQRELLSVMDGQGAGLAAMASAQHKTEKDMQGLRRQARVLAELVSRAQSSLAGLAARTDAQAVRTDNMHRHQSDTARALRHMAHLQEDSLMRQGAAETWASGLFTAASHILPVPPPPPGGQPLPPVPEHSLPLPDASDTAPAAGGGDSGASAVALEAAEARRQAAALEAELAGMTAPADAGSPSRGWERYTDASTGRKYWHQGDTGVSVWEHAGQGHRILTTPAHNLR
eukprot:TRINITY_DN10632_c2_g1_i2.p1 TRINITY_DN10632_c2_g1~~TRINITY_DN10632_c2_g1_i2.p1  ORF type:complete len:1211 (+),score=401.82 TRINITY_DN10632_c2_g1_i2:60-3692(+)